MEYPQGETDGFGALMLRLIDQSGYAAVRMDKPGVGESQGICEKTDFQTELEGWQAAFDSMSKYDFIDPNRIFVLGLSNGGGFSPLVSRQHPVRGFQQLGTYLVRTYARTRTQAADVSREITGGSNRRSKGF
ncbi:MAG TPA: hypothetical protein VOA64_05540 [Candidatus Dormibacteraeota bacterium]|nr:hypothetical protein [Candidatus Dormibacteraeota bacterium]